MRARRAVLALGSNLGDRGDTLQGGVNAIAGIEGVQLTGVSPVYETVPVGGPPQPDYLNAVVLADIAIPTRELLDELHQVEAVFDRVRLVRWGPRTLDIDIVTVDGEHSDDPDLTLPHPRAHERAFVLAPWHDVDPGAVLPGHGPVAALLAGTDASGIRRSEVPLVVPEARQGVVPEARQGVVPEARQGVVPEARQGVVPEARQGVVPEARQGGPLPGAGS